MAGYSDTRQLIIDTLMGRPAGTEIQPEDHQAFALQIIDYIRSVELVAGNATPIGFADASTVPVQPDNGQAVYLSSVGGAQTVVFSNFIDQNGNAISVTSTANVIKLVTLLWNGQYWSPQITSVNAVRDTTNGYLFMGVATPETDPGTPDHKVFYIATQTGIYSNFNSIEISEGEAVTLQWNNTWTKKALGFATQEKLAKAEDVLNGRKIVKIAETQAWRLLYPMFRGKTYRVYNGTPKVSSAYSIDTNLIHTPIFSTSINGNSFTDITPEEDVPGIGGWCEGGTHITIEALDSLESQVKVLQEVTGEYKEIERYILVFVDADGKFLFGITKSGELDWKKGIPGHVAEKIYSKVDKKIGYSLIQSKVANSITYTDIRYIKVEIDADGKIISYTMDDGTVVHNARHIFNDEIIVNSLGLSPKAAFSICEKLTQIEDLFAKYPHAQYLPKIAKLKKGYDNYFSGKETTPPLLIAHLSDVHGDEIAIQNIRDFTQKYAIYIDDVYLTGDIVKAQFPDDLLFLNEEKNNFLLVIGNHDSWKKNQVPVEVVTEKEVYDKFFKPYISNWGVVQPSDAESGKCYYYKDYIDSKIRVIAVNCMHDTQDQLDFVTNALSDARNKSLSVVVMSHYTADFTNGVDVTFNTIDYESLGGDHGTFNPKVANVLETFIDEGGQFIAWIGGHYHIDMFGYMLNHPRLLQINIEGASGRPGNDGTDTLRIGADTEAFNIVSFDTAMGFIKILRIGDNTDRHLRNKNVLVYDYINKKVISNY